MKLLEQKIISEGRVYPGEVLKVDNFLNHQIDVDFLCEIGKELHRLYKDANVTKILTIEASGIGIACITAQYFHVPVLFAKKTGAANMSENLYVSSVESFTRGQTFSVVASKEYLQPGDRVLILDDFLAKGSALHALLDIVAQAGATAVGCGIVIEKAYQNGGADLRASGIRVESLARIASMSVEDGIKFC